MKKIRIYDDDRRLGERYAKKLGDLDIIKTNFEVELLKNEDFKEEMKVLISRQNMLRHKGEWDEKTSKLDETSIFIIDYDLLKTDPNSFLTGENISYLTRCFSKCSIIIGLNQYGTNTFDLTLKGHIESYADLNIGSEQLDNLGLWGEENALFKPWYWPQLPKYLESFNKKIKDVIDHIEDPICEVLGIDDVIETFPRTANEFIGGDSTKTSFKEFVISSENGLRRLDVNPTDDMVGRIGGARVSKWLERLLLPGQDILVDTPHLVYRYPSLLKDDPENIESWNKTTTFLKVEDLGIDYERIQDYKFKPSYWLSRHAWFWKKLSDNQKIKEVLTPWERKVINFRFCEDTSKFHSKEECAEFIIESDSPYIRRFLLRENLKNANYRPKVRLL